MPNLDLVMRQRPHLSSDRPPQGTAGQAPICRGFSKLKSLVKLSPQDADATEEDILATFHQFKELPVEIRLKIVSYSLLCLL